MSLSSALGSSFPDGWLCATTIAAALSAMASAKTSLVNAFCAALAGAPTVTVTVPEALFLPSLTL